MKFYIKNKLEQIPENLNFVDLAIKLCLQEIAYQKSVEKSGSAASTNLGDALLGLNTVQVNIKNV